MPFQLSNKMIMPERTQFVKGGVSQIFFVLVYPLSDIYPLFLTPQQNNKRQTDFV
jgi:hypothetical protein